MKRYLGIAADVVLAFAALNLAFLLFFFMGWIVSEL